MGFKDFLGQVTKIGNPTSYGTPSTAFKPMDELGVSGLRIASGYVYEEFLLELQGVKGRKIFREMSDNDATVGALLTAIDSMLRAVEWRVEPNEDFPDEQEAEWLDTAINDMEHTFEDFISEVLTYLVFGFSFFEVVYKRRGGLYTDDLSKRSLYDDGLIGIRKLAPRAQETLLRWELDEQGDVIGFWQQPPMGGDTVFIPSSKGLLFRTTSRKNNPEGRSILRNAYTSYYYKKNIQVIEAIAIERELAGMPIVEIPSEIMVDPKHDATFKQYQQIARDLKFNEQGGLVIPSDTYKDTNGTLTTVKKVDVRLISAGGSRAIDTNAVITRYDQAIARTVLADFLILGASSKGSFALSKSKTDLFLRSISGYIDGIAAILNRNLVPQLWKVNGKDPKVMPVIKPGDVAPVDLAELGDYVSKLASAGMIFGGDPPTEEALRSAADLPTEVVDQLPIGPDDNDSGPVNL